MSYIFLEETGASDPTSFQGICSNDFPIVEDLVQVNIFLYDMMDRAMIGKFARRCDVKHSNTVQLLRYNSHFCYLSNIRDLFETYHCTLCDFFIDKAGNLERHLTTCRKRDNEINIVSQKTCFSSFKHCLTNFTCWASLIQTTKDSLTT